MSHPVPRSDRTSSTGCSAKGAWAPSTARRTHASGGRSRSRCRLYLGHVDPDERFAIVTHIPKGEPTNSDIVRLLLGGTGEPQKLQATPGIDYAPTLSPDGRWLAYVSTFSGVQEVWVRELEGTGQWQVSTAGGIGPRWSPNGRSLYFRRDTVQMVSAIEPGTSFRAGTPRQLFTGTFNWRTEAGLNYAIDPVTGRFLMILPPSDSTAAGVPIRVIANWRAQMGGS